MPESVDVVQAYRLADQRLRLMLLGDGVSEPGMVKGEEARARVTAALRHMRELFNRAVVAEDAGASVAEARMIRLEEELLRLVSRAVQDDRETDAYLTPAQAAEALGVSVSTVYRAVKANRLRPLPIESGRKRALRIPVRELDRMRAVPRAHDSG